MGGVSNINEVSAARWELAQRRKEAIASIDGTQNVSDQVMRVAAQLGVSRRTVDRLRAQYLQMPQTSALLLRPRGTPAGAHRIDESLDRLIFDVINDVYRTVLDLCCTLPVAGHLDHEPISCASSDWSREVSLGPELPSWDLFGDTLKVSFAN
jgi:hypothetical protein